MNGPVVIKVGGSLFSWPGLPERLRAYVDARRSERPVLLAGGGPMVDVIRQLDRVHALGEDRSHSLAIRTLDLTAAWLGELLPGAAVIDHLDALGAAWAAGKFPVFAPRLFLENEDRGTAPLPHSWSVTSDSIAARLACRLDARELVLLKSAGLPHGFDRTAAARAGLVDPEFPREAEKIRTVSYIDFRAESLTAYRLD